VVEDTDREALLEVLNSGVWGIGGTKQAHFEENWSEFTHSRYTVTTSSGSTALVCALRALEIGPGDEVIIPAYTFQATASSILLTNAVPVFADVDSSLCLSPAAAEAAITPRTRALMPVHVAGCPADMDGLKRVAEKHNLTLIEDACQAHGAAWRGQPVGSIGAAGAFSFQSSKNLPAGEGGAVTTSNPLTAARSAAVRNCGNALAGLETDALVGTNFRLTEFQAALLLSGLKRLPAEIALRERNAATLDEQLAKIEGILPLPRAEGVTTHAHHLYIFRYRREVFGGAPRSAFIRALQAEGIPCHGGYQPLYRAPFLSDAAHRTKTGFRDQDAGGYGDLYLPETELACTEAVWLTQRLLLGSDEQTGRIIEAVQKIRDQSRELLKL